MHFARVIILVGIVAVMGTQADAWEWTDSGDQYFKFGGNMTYRGRNYNLDFNDDNEASSLNRNNYFGDLSLQFTVKPSEYVTGFFELHKFVFLGQVLSDQGGIHTFGDLRHFIGYLSKRTSLGEFDTHMVIAAQGTGAGGDDITQTGQSRKSKRIGTQHHTERRYLGQTASHESGPGVITVAEPVGNAGTKGQDVLQ